MQSQGTDLADFGGYQIDLLPAMQTNHAQGCTVKDGDLIGGI
jgi:hypothetical protein